MGLLRVRSESVDPRFLLYAYLGPDFQDTLRERTIHGSTVNRIPLVEMPDFPIRIPVEVQEQRAIASILGSLDDKIELNQRMNRTLETMARAIFKAWFIDFEPVKAKAAGASSFRGMPQDVFDQLPEQFTQSERGPIPLDWRTLTLDNVTSLLRRGIPPAYVEVGGVCAINQRCIRDQRVDLSSSRRHDPRKRKIDGRELELGDVLVNSTGVGTLGRVAQALRLEEPTICDSHITVLRADREEVTPNFLGALVKALEPDIERLGEGSTGQTELSKKRLGAVAIVVPPLPLQRSFDELTRPLLSLSVTNDSQTITLAEIRDALLPKFISGTIRVPGTEGVVDG